MKLTDLFEDDCNCGEDLLEITSKRKRVVRKGKVVKKRKCPPGYRLVGRRCVKQKARERMRRKLGAKRGSRKSKSARKRNYKRSIRIRKRRNL